MANEKPDVATFLERREPELLSAAEAAVSRAHLDHYEAAGVARTDERLHALLEIVIGCCRAHHLEPALSYAKSLAVRRQSSGYSLAEVQTVINILEEAVWRAITTEMAADSQAYALGMVSTVLGAVKDSVACGYLAEISHGPVRSLRVESLFAGTEAAAED